MRPNELAAAHFCCQAWWKPDILAIGRPGPSSKIAKIAETFTNFGALSSDFVLIAAPLAVPALPKLQFSHGKMLILAKIKFARC